VRSAGEVAQSHLAARVGESARGTPDRPPRRPPEGASPSDRSECSALLHGLAYEICEHARTLMHSDLTHTEVLELVQEAHNIADVPFNAGVAARWGLKNFPGGISESFVSHCMELFEAAGRDYTRMTATRLRELRPGRLNAERVSRLSRTNPELSRLAILAEGMVVPLPPGFCPNGASSVTRPKLRDLFVRTHLAVEKKFFEMAEAGLAFVLPMSVAETIPGIHFSPAHWAVKQDKECGRPIIDSSDRSSKTPVLNSREVAKAAEELWSAIELPTIVQIVHELNAMKASAPHRPWTDMVIWKLDLRGAFTLMSFRAEDSKLFAVELTGGRVMLFLCGLFGWTATPAAFNVISRAIIHELRVTLGLRAHIYVDDTIGISWVEEYERDIADSTVIMEDLCGPKSVADDKTDFTRPGRQRVDVLGYALVLDEQLLTISRRNFFKTFYAFTSVDIGSRVPVRTLERLASLSSRYSLICPVLRPFCRPLYASYAGLRRNVSVVLAPAARWAVRMWRAVLCCTVLRERLFARSFMSFVPGGEDYMIEFDASLEGGGLKVFDTQGTRNHEVIVGAGALMFNFLLEGDSSYQNSCEFLGALIGLVTLLRFCNRRGRPRPKVVSFRGDSITALTWVGNENFRGEYSFCTATIFALVMAKLGVQVGQVVHLPKERNTDCDELSRGRSVSQVLGPTVDDWGLGEDPVVQELLELCNPTRFEEFGSQFEVFWTRASNLVVTLSHTA